MWFPKVCAHRPLNYVNKYKNIRFKHIKMTKSQLNDFGVKQLNEKINGKEIKEGVKNG